VERLAPADITFNIHELANSLAAIIGNAQILARKIDRGGDLDLAAAAATSRVIQSQGWKATKAMRELLPLMRAERPCCHVTPCPACEGRASDTEEPR
jgi:signal transduction histidine kinase